MFNASWHTFNVPDPNMDAIVFMFQILFERLEMTLKQKWLGGCPGCLHQVLLGGCCTAPACTRAPLACTGRAAALPARVQA